MAKATAGGRAQDSAADRLVELRGAAGASSAPVVAALAALAAAWTAAGSVGLMAHGLRHVLVLLALAVAVLADWRGQAHSPLRLWTVVAAGALAAVLTASVLPAVNVLAAVVLLCGLAIGREGRPRRILVAAALAAGLFALYRLAYTSIAAAWLAADALGGLLGRLAGALAGRPTRLGATFAGVDFLVLAVALAAACALGATGPRWKRALGAALALAAGHLAYLAVIALAADLQGLLPKAEPSQGWSWAGVLQAAVPWNLPAVGAAIHLAIAGGLLAWTPWAARAATTAPAGPQAPPAPGARRPRWLGPVEWGATALLAAALPAAALLPTSRGSLEGKKVVAYKKGFLNWLKPRHGEYGRLSVGMYGMLPHYVEALGGQWCLSSDLSPQDLQDADVLILLYPDERWRPEQLERIRRFVEEGGGLLVMGEHTVHGAGDDGALRGPPRPPDPNEDANSPFNEALRPTGMHVRFDSATFAVGGWLHSYEALAHPATAGIGDDRNEFGVVIGASVDAPFPARPLLIGKWGWADAGDEGGSAMLGNHRYDAGEKLGDLVLAAERRLGKGTVIAFGDTSSMTNGITVGAHVFTSRLLAYLASGGGAGQAMWRQALGLVLAAGLVALCVVRAGPVRLAVAALAMAASLTACTWAAQRLAEVLPDGRHESPNNLAYVDMAHMGAFSEESWRPQADGLGGLELTLMRNGFLTLALPEFDERRIERAGLVVSVAPQREFSPAQRRVVRRFVEDGGVFIVTAGHDLGQAARSLLADFGFQIGNVVADPDARVPEPQPMGHFKSPYRDTGRYRVYVRFHAAWPVAADKPEEARVVAYGRGNRPVIMYRNVGKGKFVVVGDAMFCINRNLEHEGGQPFEGLHENADFWRWFLTVLRGQPEWVPPRDVPAAPAETRPAATQPAASAPDAATQAGREGSP